MPTYLNGALPNDQLVPIPWAPRHRVRFYALASLVRLNAAFRAAFGHDLVINEAYRPIDRQWAYYRDPPSGAGTAAYPGTSNHGWGLAIDFKLKPAEYAWMLAHAPRFGWVNPLWARDGKGVEEPWHWEHAGTSAVVPDPISTPTRQEDSTMRIISGPLPWDPATRQQVYVTDSGGAGNLTDPEAAVLRQNWPSHDYDSWDHVETEVRLAWARHATATAQGSAELTAEQIADAAEAGLRRLLTALTRP